MTTQATRAPAPTLDLADNEPQPLDLHDLYHALAAGGYDRTLTFPAHQVESLVGSLRGINAITAVLIAGTDADQLKLSDWIRGGLVSAIHRLAWDMSDGIERANDRAREATAKQGAAA